MNENTVEIVGNTNSFIAKSIKYYLEKEDFQMVENSIAEYYVIIGDINSKNFAKKYHNKKIVLVNTNYKINTKNSISLRIKVDEYENLKNKNDEFKRFTFDRGQLSPLNKLVLQFFKNDTLNLNNAHIDLTDVKVELNNYTFEFESLSDSYKWFNYKNFQSKRQRLVESLKYQVYDDSDFEIRYLTNRIRAVKRGYHIEQIYLCTQEEFTNVLSRNYFYVELKKFICPTFKSYFLDLNILEKQSKRLLYDVRWGLMIYDDCVYIDYNDNPISMGYVDLKEETYEKFNKIYDELIKLSVEIKK